MRKILLIAAAAVFAFSACTKENGNGSAEKGEIAKISVKFTNPTMTRALDDIDDPVNGVVQDRLQFVNANVFFFNATGALMSADYDVASAWASGKTYTYAATSTGSNNGPNFTTAIAKVVVVGNVDDLTTGVTPAVNSEATLNAHIRDLMQAETDYRNVSAPSIWVYASSGITWGATTDGVTSGAVSLEPNPIMARIDATVNYGNITNGIREATTPEGNVANSYPAIEFDGVAVLYSASATHFTPTFAPSRAAVELSGSSFNEVFVVPRLNVTNWVPMYANNNWYSSVVGGETFLHASWTDGYWNGEPNITGNTFTRSFYAFAPGNTVDYYPNGVAPGTPAGTILTVYGRHITYDTGNTPITETSISWPVHFSPDETATGGGEYLKPGYRYNVSINFSGDFSNGGGGTWPPEIPVNKAEIGVTIEVAKWKMVINISKDFTGN